MVIEVRTQHNSKAPGKEGARIDMSDGGYAILLGDSQAWYSTAIYDDAAAYVLTP